MIDIDTLLERKLKDQLHKDFEHESNGTLAIARSLSEIAKAWNRIATLMEADAARQEEDRKEFELRRPKA